MENNRLSILIVDDTPKNLQVLGNTLKMSNYKVEFAINGFKALEWIEKQSFDLILLDVMMPEMDGYQVCEKIRKDKKNENLPIIFLTAKTDEESIVHGFKIGAQDYITKPFNTQELLVRVKTQLELKTSREKLESVNKWLENEVEKRTRQIEETNLKLEKANKELMGLDQAKTNFLTIISNEMREPLNGILSTMHVLKDQIDSKELVQLVAVVDTSVKKLEKFSSYALEVTALKTKKIHLELVNINLVSLFEQCAIDLAALQKQHKVAINTTMSEDVELTADSNLLTKASQLVLENFIKRSNSETEITINYQKKDGAHCIIFENQGQEFSDQMLEQDFEIKNPETNSYDPVGLDLNLVKLIAEAHHGNINLVNEGPKIKLTLVINGGA